MPHLTHTTEPDDPTNAFIKEYSRFTQFHGIPDQTLMRLAERKTGLHVANRWVAIALIIRNPVPIPVPGMAGASEHRGASTGTRAKLQLVKGGRAPETQEPTLNKMNRLAEVLSRLKK